MARPFSLRDLGAIKRLQSQGVAFDQRRVLLYPSLPLQSAILGYLTHHHWGALTCVQDGFQQAEAFGGDLGARKGFAQVWPRGDGSTWDLTYIAPALDKSPELVDTWCKLLGLLIIQGAEQNVQRFYARSPEVGAIEDALRQVGFAVLGREEVFCLQKQLAPAPAPAPKGLCRMTRKHHAAVTALYRRVQPRLQQQVECLPPYGNGDHYLHIASPASDEEFVWAIDDRVVAYLGLARSSRAYWLEVMVQPEWRGDLLPYIKYVIALAECSRQMPVYCAVPDYGVGLGWLLRTCGFHSFARQTLLVAYPLARIPLRRRVMVPGLKGRVDVGTTAKGMKD